MSCEKCGREIKNYGVFLGGIRCENWCGSEYIYLGPHEPISGRDEYKQIGSCTDWSPWVVKPVGRVGDHAGSYEFRRRVEDHLRIMQERYAKAVNALEAVATLYENATGGPVFRVADAAYDMRCVARQALQEMRGER